MSLRRTVALVATGALLVGGLDAASAQEGSLTDQLRDNREAQEEVEAELATTREEIARVANEITDSQSRLTVFEAELAALRVRLEEAEAAAAEAAAATATATEELLAVDSDVRATEALLSDARRELDDRAATAFMGGSVDVTGVLLNSDDVGELLHSAYYVQVVLDADRIVLDDVTDAALLLENLLGVAEEHRRDVTDAQVAADEAERELATLTAAAEDLAAEAADERDRQQGLYARLENKQAVSEAQLAELEAESEALAEELRNSRWRAGAPGVGSFVWPSDGRISSSFGYRTHPIYGTRRLHAGVDIAGGFGVPVVAANDGLVLSAYCSPGGYGCRVVIDHGGGIASLYAHLSSFSVAEDDVVIAGDPVGLTGSTGASTGPHLHFEIRRSGTPENPMEWF